MANAAGTLASAVIIQRALELVFTMRPILGAISLDLSDERCKFNQQIISRKFSVATVNNFGTGATDRADSDVAVTIDQFKEVHHAFTPQELSGTDRNLVEESALPIAIAVGNHMVDQVATLWTEANFQTAVAGDQSTTQAVAANNYATLVTLRKALNTRGVPDRPRFVAANSDVYEKWLNDSTVVAALNNQNNGGAIQSGVLPGVAGFEGIYEYPALPNTGNMTAFAGYKDTVVIACRLPRDPREVLQNASFPGNLGIVTEPRTGMSVMVNEWIDAATLKANVRLLWMYGKSAGNKNNGQILKSA